MVRPVIVVLSVIDCISLYFVPATIIMITTIIITGMAIAFLNDPERQHALAHLRKQMMLSNPQECMLCKGYFDSSADVRCCPW